MSNPIRMCISCRTEKDKTKLLKIVKQDNNVCIDKSYSINGRSAYVCKNEECINKCIKNKLLNRAFKQNIDEQVYLSLKENIGE